MKKFSFIVLPLISLALWACSSGLQNFTVRGNVAGLDGTLELQGEMDDETETVTVTESGSYEIIFPAVHGAAYAVTVKVQPANQTCVVENGTGVVNYKSVVVNVNCSDSDEEEEEPETFAIGGGVIGVTGGTLVFQNNGGDDISISIDGNFTFDTEMESGETYEITVLTPPAGKLCKVVNGEGTVTADVTDISIICAQPKRMFVTGATVAGSFGGVSVADTACENEQAGYLAMVVEAGVRQACSFANCEATANAEHLDWVLDPNTPYVRMDGTTLVGFTDATALLEFPLEAGINGNGSALYWTGLNSDWTIGTTCLDWTSNSNLAIGDVGDGAGTSINVFTQAYACNFPKSFLCVEQ
jgi:hypothetical protein